MDAPPICECHGKPKQWRSDKRRASGGYWSCRAMLYEAQRRYARTEQGRKTKRRYNVSEKGRAVQETYEQTRVKVQVGGVKTNYRVPPEKKEEIVAKLAAHRAGQITERREVARHGRND